MFKNIIYITVSIVILSCQKESIVEPSPSIKDLEGNIYQTVKIGDQHWMAENLNYEGNYLWSIPLKKNGTLYDEKTILGTKDPLCPQGWHVPFKSDWDKLILFTGGDLTKIGEILKMKNIPGWSNSQSKDYGFNALPTGYFDRFNSLPMLINTDSETRFWGINKLSNGTTEAWIYGITSKESNLTIQRVSELPYYKGTFFNFSCRCVKD